MFLQFGDFPIAFHLRSLFRSAECLSNFLEYTESELYWQKKNTMRLEAPKLRFQKPLFSATNLILGTFARLARTGHLRCSLAWKQ